MKIFFTYTLPNTIELVIIEMNHTLIKRNFNNRFQVILNYKDEKIFPKSKQTFLNFKQKNIIYTLKSDKYKKIIELTEDLFYEKQICDKSLEQCKTEIMEYMSLYNSDLNIFFNTIRKDFKF